MSAQLVYARFPSPAHRAARDWMRAVDDVCDNHGGDLSARPESAGPAGPIAAWRLVSDNHREIARGCRFFATERLARADAAVLLRHAPDLAVHPSVEPRLRTTGWFVTLDRRLVMIGARRYENRSVARNAGALAVRLLAEMARDAADGAAGRERPAPEFAL